MNSASTVCIPISEDISSMDTSTLHELVVTTVKDFVATYSTEPKASFTFSDKDFKEKFFIFYLL